VADIAMQSRTNFALLALSAKTQTLWLRRGFFAVVVVMVLALTGVVLANKSSITRNFSRQLGFHLLVPLTKGQTGG
jgi:hypothetical protein